MNDDMTDDERRESWERLIRRASNLPDLMTPESARSTVVAELAERIEHDDLPAERAQGIAVRIYKKAIELGASGRLDDVFVDLPHLQVAVREVTNAGNAAPEARIVLEAGVLGTSDTTNERARKATAELLGWIQDYAKEHPEIPRA